jgi:CD109 antigen
VTAQIVRRYNLPEVLLLRDAVFELDVQYDAEDIEVDDLLTITATIRFTPPETIASGMVVLDVSVPTGFAPESASIDALLASEPKLKRWDLAGRKVILYIDDMRPNEQLRFTFQARALYPVRAQPVASQVYAYYRPEWQREQLGVAVVVGAV